MKRLLIAGLLVVACSSQTPTPTPLPTGPPTPSPSPSPEPYRTLPAPHTALEPGRYQSGVVSLSITFEVGPGWTYEQRASEFFDIEQDPGSPDVIAVQFAGVEMDPLPRDIVAAIDANDQVKVIGRKEVELDCHLTATRLTVEPVASATTDPPVFVPVVNVIAGTLSIATGRRLQLDIFNFHMGGAIILVGGSIAHWDEALAAAQPVLASLTLRPSGGASCD